MGNRRRALVAAVLLLGCPSEEPGSAGPDPCVDLDWATWEALCDADLPLPFEGTACPSFWEQPALEAGAATVETPGTLDWFATLSRSAQTDSIELLRTVTHEPGYIPPGDDVVCGVEEPPAGFQELVVPLAIDGMRCGQATPSPACDDAVWQRALRAGSVRSSADLATCIVTRHVVVTTVGEEAAGIYDAQGVVAALAPLDTAADAAYWARRRYPQGDAVFPLDDGWAFTVPRGRARVGIVELWHLSPEGEESFLDSAVDWVNCWGEDYPP